MFHWLSTNHFVANRGKCHVLATSKKPVDIHISNTEILNEEKVKLLGVNLEGRLNFDFHVNTLLRKASKIYYALARVCNYMKKKRKKEATYSHECFHNISVFLLPSCLDVP